MFLYSLELTLAVYVMLFVCQAGYGQLAAYLLNIKKFNHNLFICNWIGFAFLLFMLQIVHLFIPITGLVSIVIFGIGIGIAIIFFRNNLHSIKDFWSNHRRILILTVAGCMLFAIGTASVGMLSPTHLDTGLYHLNAVNWLNSYPIVKGLGNIHGNLAYNQLFFHWVALLNFSPWLNFGYCWANSFLILLAFSHLLWESINLFSAKSNNSRRSAKYFLVFSLPIVLYLFSFSISSLETDFLTGLMQIVLMYLLLEMIDNTGNANDQISILKILILLAVCSVTCKLSCAVYSLSMIFSGIAVACCSGNRPIQILHSVAMVVSLGIIIMTIWACRGIYQTGVPVYPLKAMRFDVKWAICDEQFKYDNDFIYGWARNAKGDVKKWDSTLHGWSWLPIWIKTHTGSREILNSLRFASISLLFLLFVCWHKSCKTYFLKPFILIYFSLLCSLVFWFFMAPDIRFARVLIWLTVILPLVHACTLLSRREAETVSVFCLLLFIVFMPYGVDNLKILTTFHEGYQKVSDGALTTRKTYSGLKIYAAKEHLCWGAPLPATPYFNPNLKLIGNSLGDGFYVDKSKHNNYYFPPR